MRRLLLSSTLVLIYHNNLLFEYRVTHPICGLNLLKMAASIAPECNEIKEYVYYCTFLHCTFVDSRWTNMRFPENMTPAS